MLDQPAAAHPALAIPAPQPRGAVRGGEPNAKSRACRNLVGALTATCVLGHRP